MMNLFKVSEIHLLIRSMSTDSSTHLVAIVNQQPVPRIHLRCLLQKYCLLFLELQRPLVDEVFQLPIAHGCRRCTVKHHHHHHHHHHQYHHHLQQQQQQISSLHLSMSLLRQSCHNRCYTILAVNWQDHISNNEVRRQVQRKWTVTDIIRQRNLQLFSHICRMPDDRLLKSLVFGMVEGDRWPGRPVWRWIDILMWHGQDVQQAMMMTVDRDN